MGQFLKNRQLQSGSTGVVLPTGSSANRPDNPVFGMIRYNTDSGFVEYFNGTIWSALSPSGSITYDVDTFTGDGSTTAFTMSQAESSVEQIQVFVGSIYQEPTTAYTVNGSFTITFTSAPPSGQSINVIHTQN
jgi:hypothetical protein